MSSEGSRAPMTHVTSEEFRRACGRFTTGVTVASVLDAAGVPHGLTVSSLASVSLDPPLILICLGHQVSVIHSFREAKYFGINILAENQQELSERFARRGVDRFEGIHWHAGETGVPLLTGTLASIECEVRQRHIAGDHDIFIGEMVRTRVHEGEPLVHFASRYRKLQG